MTSNEQYTGLVKDLIESIIQSRDVLIALVQQAVKDGVSLAGIHNEVIKQVNTEDTREEVRKFANNLLTLFEED